MYSFLVSLLRPYFLLLVLIGVALWWLTRRAKPGRARAMLLWSPYLLLVAVSSPLTAYYVVGSLEWQYPVLWKRPADAQAIVVLGASYLQSNRFRDEPELDRIGRVRVEAAARYFHDGEPIPVLTSGGVLVPEMADYPIANLMRDLLFRLGVPPGNIWTETRSKTTYENAVECAAILREKGIRRIVLVTDATHLPRAVACFRAQGLDVIPSGCYHIASGWELSWDNLQPNVDCLDAVDKAAHEWIGSLWYRLCGRL